MEARTFFTVRQLTEIRTRYTQHKDYLESGQKKPISPQSDFKVYRDAALYSYLGGDLERAAKFLCAAVAIGFPPRWNFEIKDDHDRQWKNCQDGGYSLDVGLAAHILGMNERRDQILAWTVERLLDTEMFTQGADPQHSDVILVRTYALLAAGRYWPKISADLTLVARQIRDATDNTCDWALPKTLTAVVQCKKGNVSRRQATNSLVQLILDSKGDLHDKIDACFHVLYLQSAFSDVFDPVLPPFPVHLAP